MSIFKITKGLYGKWMATRVCCAPVSLAFEGCWVREEGARFSMEAEQAPKVMCDSHQQLLEVVVLFLEIL